MKNIVLIMLSVVIIGGSAVTAAAGELAMFAVVAGLLIAGMAVGVIGARMVFDSEKETSLSDNMPVHGKICAN